MFHFAKETFGDARNLLEEFLDGKVRDRVEAVDLNEIVREVAAVQQESADYGKVSKPFTLRLAADLPRISLIPARFKRVLMNLLQNAAHAMPRGGKIEIETGFDSVTGEIVLKVSDTGIGIPQEEQQKIPKKFFRASNIASPTASGTGIGLYMVYNIVRLIGGTISFVSQENKGTTFTLLLPS